MRKMVSFILVVFTLIMAGTVYAKEVKEVPFTLDDRDRLIRVETKVEEGLKAVNQRIDGLDKRIDGLDKRIDGLDKRIDGLQTIMIGGFGIIASGMIALVGFVLWDRRTALAPAIRKNKELEEREEKIERALKELAYKDPNVAEALRHVGLL
jgi:chaperonin cofactor prefoldin